MTQESRKGRLPSGPTTSRFPVGENTRPGYPTQPLRDQLGDWWTDPALAYWMGLQDGVELAQRQDEDDHRATVRGIGRFVEAADRRAAHDRDEAAA